MSDDGADGGSDHGTSPARIPPTAGLCARCIHARLIVSGRGSQFVLCERSRTDPRFPRYPSLPVVVCAGFERRPGT